MGQVLGLGFPGRRLRRRDQVKAGGNRHALRKKTAMAEPASPDEEVCELYMNIPVLVNNKPVKQGEEWQFVPHTCAQKAQGSRKHHGF